MRSGVIQRTARARVVRDGAIGGLSIGYRTIREQLVGKTRQLLELALYEVSLVTIPMNERAVRAPSLSMVTRV